jgi:hypothetical protein
LNAWRPNRKVRLTLTAVVLLLLIIGGWLSVSAFGTSRQDQVVQQGLAYAERQMVWSSGPSVQSTHSILTDYLTAALQRYVPLPVRADVNAQDFIRRHGLHRRYLLIVLYGTYNSLPPDEGVEVHGDVVELVDPKSRRVVLLTN